MGCPAGPRKAQTTKPPPNKSTQSFYKHACMLIAVQVRIRARKPSGAAFKAKNTGFPVQELGSEETKQMLWWYIFEAKWHLGHLKSKYTIKKTSFYNHFSMRTCFSHIVMAIEDHKLVEGLWQGRYSEVVRIRARKFYKHACFSISTQVFYKHAHALIRGGLPQGCAKDEVLAFRFVERNGSPACLPSLFLSMECSA